MDLGFKIINYNGKGYITKIIMTENEFAKDNYASADLILKKKNKVYLLERVLDVEYKNIKEDTSND